jgi:type II secretion system protein C
LGKQHGKSKGARTLALCIGIGFGVVLAPRFWPHVEAWLHEKENRPPQVHAGIPAAPSAVPPMSASPPQKSDQDFAGTRSSVSPEPLPLILSGTVVASRAAESVAFIGVDEHNPQTYAAGAVLANGALLTEIGRNYVVLERDGASVRLYAQNVKGHAREQSDLLMVGASTTFTPAKSNNTDTFTEFLRPNPVYEGDALVGVEVFAGKRSALFSRLGFQGGDVITAIDDVPVNDPQAASEALHQLASGVGGVVTVKRKGKTERFTLDGTLVTEELNRNTNVSAAAAATVPRPAT